MPELPEVEAVRRLLERSVVGHRIVGADVRPDPIVWKGADPDDLRRQLTGVRVAAAARHGKLWWLELDSGYALFGHLGMSGWVRETGTAIEKRLVSHGTAPMDGPDGEPRFLKLKLTADTGRAVAMTDGRRLGRLWIAPLAQRQEHIHGLGPDAWLDLPEPKVLAGWFAGRKAPVKALLMDQSKFAGIGNWVADEVLYQARIAPHRAAGTLNTPEIRKLRASIVGVLELAVSVEADASQYPPDWLFHVRWGGNHGAKKLGRHTIQRDTVGGRTTAWVPTLQK